MSGDTYYEKRAVSWDVSDINKLVGLEEGVYLEFKKPSEFFRDGRFSRDVFVNELTETVSAFLNSDGGALLVGVQTDKNETDRRVELLKPLEEWSTGQTFEHMEVSLTASQILDIIHGNIIPKPTGIGVTALEVSISEGATTVFVVTVEPSPLGAHQSARTQRYYRRTSDGDDPMLDFDIRAVNNRRAGPLLRLSCRMSSGVRVSFEEDWSVSSAGMESVGSDDGFYRANLVIAVSNLGRGTADTARFDIGVPHPWRIEHHSPDGTVASGHWVANSGLPHSIGNEPTVFWNPDKCTDIPRPYREKRISEQLVSWNQVIYAGNEPPAHPIWPGSGRRVIAVVRLQRKKSYDVAPFSWLPWRTFPGAIRETKGAVLLIQDSGILHAYNYEMDDVDWWYQAEGMQRFEELINRFQVP